jgi:hypothetical protein
MKDSDILRKEGFGEALKGGGHQLYVRAQLKCAIGNHVVEKTFTVDEFDEEKLRPESWSCPAHRAKR